MKKSMLRIKYLLGILGVIGCMTVANAQRKGQGSSSFEQGIPQSPEDISPLLVGERIPEAILLNAMGHPVELSKLISEKPTILIFYRGGWCPYCSRQLSGLQEIWEDLQKIGYQLVAISTDKPAKLSESSSEGHLKYTLLSDADLTLSKKFGIAYKSPRRYEEILNQTTDFKNVELLLPVPSVFVLNRKGTIYFEYINVDITQRLNPEILKAVSQSLIAEL